MNTSNFTRAEMNALKEEWFALLKRAEDCLKVIDDIDSRALMGLTFSSLYERRLEEETEGLWEDYEDLCNRTQDYLGKKVGEKVLPKVIPIPPSANEGEVRTFLQRVAGESRKTLRLIDDLLYTTELSSRDRERLYSLEKEVRDNIKPFLPEYASDLEKALDAFSNQNLTCSVLLAGRVIEVIWSKIKSKVKEEKGMKEAVERKEPEWEDLRPYIRDMVGRESEKVIQAIKLYRNKFSHRVGSYPTPEESLIMLSGAVLLAKGYKDGINPSKP
ncbi:MAG: hypothetical protein DRN19_01050 [Thermoplasmata archaeon]|nr:MAG: hypothetical protein FE042_03670 [Thermoplasmata archaeon]RLF52397.1 MAG: hypothetical protein DRN19_01050 [Thermoplasmata archaeon]